MISVHVHYPDGGGGRSVQYTVRAPPFSVHRWLLLAATLSVILFTLRVHELNTTVLAAILSLLCVVLVLKIQYKVKEESLLVVGSLGVQLSVRYASGRCSTQLVSSSRVCDLLVCETISMNRVVTYLALLTSRAPLDRGRAPGGCCCGGDLLVPLFTHTWPRLAELRRIYTGVHRVMWPSHKQHITNCDDCHYSRLTNNI